MTSNDMALQQTWFPEIIDAKRRKGYYHKYEYEPARKALLKFEGTTDNEVDEGDSGNDDRGGWAYPEIIDARENSLN